MKPNKNLVIINKTDRQIDEEIFFDIYNSIIQNEKHNPKKEIVNLLLTDDEEMLYYNATYRKIDNVTDVLSFEDTQEFSPVMGDIIINVMQAERQKQHDISDELQVLFIHGLLHLMGYDHLNKKEEIKMKNKENIYITSIRSKANRGR